MGRQSSVVLPRLRSAVAGRFVSALALVLVSSSTVQCTCTAIGCSDSVFVKLVGVSLDGRPGAVAARMCVDDLCKVQRQTFQAGGATVDGLDEGLYVDAFDESTTLEFALPPDARDEGLKHVTVEVSFDEGPTLTAETDVEVTRDYPNGRLCGDPCWAGSSSVLEADLQAD